MTSCMNPGCFSDQLASAGRKFSPNSPDAGVYFHVCQMYAGNLVSTSYGNWYASLSRNGARDTSASSVCDPGCGFLGSSPDIDVDIGVVPVFELCFASGPDSKSAAFSGLVWVRVTSHNMVRKQAAANRALLNVSILLAKLIPPAKLVVPSILPVTP